MIILKNIVLLLSINIVHSMNNNNNNNNNNANNSAICQKENSFIELEQTKTVQPIKIRSYNWCLNFPPRCSNYRTEIKEIINYQNVTKTKLLDYCCTGYRQIENLENTLQCEPICNGDCGGNGHCSYPNHCICRDGYIGPDCTIKCSSNKWGENCTNHCECENQSICDHQNGSCLCKDGWMGEFCEIPCPIGFYGNMCEHLCACELNECNPKTGECIWNNNNIDNTMKMESSSVSLNVDHPLDNNTNNNYNSNIMKITNDRIVAKHWIKINSNGKMHIPIIKNNNTGTEENYNYNDDLNLKQLIGKNQQLHKNNTITINTLNLSLTNLTENMDKLSKKLSEQQNEMLIVKNNTENLSKMSILIDPNVRDTLMSEQLTTTTTTTTTMIPITITKIKEIINLSTNNLENDEQQQQQQQQHLALITTNEYKLITKKFDDNITIIEQSNITNLDNANDDSNIIAIIIICLIVFILLSFFIFAIICILKRNREKLKISKFKKNGQNQSIDNISNFSAIDKVIFKPLPDIPSFTHSIQRITTNDFYDKPSNNKLVRNCNGLSKFSYSYCLKDEENRFRKKSLEHLYDEIKYPNVTSSIATIR